MAPRLSTLSRSLRSLLASSMRLASRAVDPPTIDGYELDREVALGLRLHAMLGRPRLSELPVEAARREQRRQVRPFAPVASVPIASHPVLLPGESDGPPVAGRIYTPPGVARPAPAVVWFHGGGWVVGSVEADDGLCRWLAQRSGCVVISVEYRLAPEHRLPAAHIDASAAWRAIMERANDWDLDPRRIAVAGSSAGGNLAASLCIDARDRGLPMPAFQLLFYPATDLRAIAPSHKSLASGFVLDRSLIDWFRGHALTPEQWVDPRISVLLTEDLSGLPPAHVVTAGFDPLRDEGEAYADRLRAAGVPTKLQRAEGLIHAFLELSGASSASAAAAKEAVAALKEALSRPT